MFLELLVSEIEVFLSLNGKHSKTVKLISHIYELNELNPLVSSKIPAKYEKEELIYTPALDDINVQKEIIKDVTEPKFHQSLYKKTEHDKKVSNDWINATSELIKSSNILNIKTLEDFEKVESVSNLIEVSNKNLKKIERNESRGQYVMVFERVLKESDVLGLSKSQLKIMRNEIFARYGHTFKSGGEMEAFFNKQDWFRNSAIDATNLLSEVEKENISFIKKYETAISTFLKISVDNLRVRASPDLNAEKIENLPINTIVEFLNKKSGTKTVVTIKGEEINEYWYQIKTSSGDIGWIHGCCFEKQ